MYNRINQVLEQYPFTIQQTYKGRGALICETDMGLKILKEYNGSQSRADFLYQALRFVKDNGMKRVDCIVKTKEGRTIATDADDIVYIMRDWYEGHECDTRNRDDILKAIRCLADLHKILKCYYQEIPEFLKVSPETLLFEYQKHTRGMKKVKNYICSKKKKNDFEMLFVRNYSMFFEQALEVVQFQEKELEQKPVPQLYGLCHGDFNQHNIVFSKEGTAILNFERAFYDIQISDLGNFMRKMLEKHNWNLSLGMDMLDAYDKERIMSEAEMRQLYIRLAYPEKFWKITNYYYNSSKSWVCGRNLEKLNKIIMQNEARERFLNVMSHNLLF